jgi:hypothetical protein
MDARPLLVEIARRLHEQHLEAVLIGNAAAALQGAPVTTVDFDFLFRKTPRSRRKMKAFAKSIDASPLAEAAAGPPDEFSQEADRPGRLRALGI